ncbi:MAG: hypothetical protein JWM39_505 [Parcubacteria group bacterium]|nr:hypothetical protein [Parcubacteria group bacterium]
MEDFDSWNKSKKLDYSNSKPEVFPKAGEVWLTVLGKNIGYEQNGVTDRFIRPCLIVKKFNNGMFWVVPLSSKQKKFNFYFNFLDPNGLPVSAILAQLRMISSKRFSKRLYSMDIKTYLRIKGRLKSFL